MLPYDVGQVYIHVVVSPFWSLKLQVNASININVMPMLCAARGSYIRGIDKKSVPHTGEFDIHIILYACTYIGHTHTASWIECDRLDGTTPD